MEQLNVKDKKILTELTLNSRIPINRLAKKVGVSREVANYRLNKLIKDKIILWFYSVIDVEALGFERYGYFIELKGVNHAKEKEFIEYLIKHDFVNYISPVIGKWNVVFDIYAKDKQHLQEIIKEIENKIGKYLEKYSIISMETALESFPTKIFGSKKEIEYKETKKDIKVDKIDLQILKELSNNSRVEYKEIAGKLKMTANAIKYRIKNMETSGILKEYTISIDKKKLGYEFYNLQLKIINYKKELELKKFLRNNKHVTYFYKYLGNENWDLDIGLIVKNSSELREFILELREYFGDIVKINDIYIIVEESKGNYAPQGIFKN